MRAENDTLPTRWTLVSRLKNPDDQGSWKEFYELYRGVIVAVAAKAGLRADEQEDVVQSTMASVARQIPEFNADPKRGSFRAWLCTIARRRTIDQLRKRMPLAAPSDGAPDTTGATPVIERVPDPRAAYLESLCDAEWTQRLKELALRELQLEVKAEHYQAYYLVAEEKRPVAQVARMIGRNPAWVYVVKHRLSRALGRIVLRLRAQWE